MKLIGEDDYGDDDEVFLDGKAGYDRSDSVDVGWNILLVDCYFLLILFSCMG